MDESTKSVLVVGFNTRPLTYSLKKAGHVVYAVDFFGDLDLYPNVKDSIIIVKKLGTNYSSIKDKYGMYLAEFTIEMLRKYPKINYLIIGSGLDDAFPEREAILNEIKDKDYKIRNLNNNLETLRKARNIEYIYNLLKSRGYSVPSTNSYEKIKEKSSTLQFPIIIKKQKSSGGINVNRIENYEELSSFITIQESKKFNPSEWIIQEYLEGIPVSCTTISNGNDCEVISINRQIIGEQVLNAPKKFMYCGNIVPAGLSKRNNELISEISKTLANKLGLRGINGFDFVLKDDFPYLMEINPRIPGSFRASELVLNLNLLDLHVKSFDPNMWNQVKYQVKTATPKGFATKMIMFAPKEITTDMLTKINDLEFIYDKTEPIKNVAKFEPLCTVLYKDKDFSRSYNGALKVINKIKKIIEELL